MTPYAGRHARLYDLFYGEKPYGAEAAIVGDILRAAGATRILDLACGTGRHATELQRQGFAVVGIDISYDMVHVAVERAATAGAVFACQDMRYLGLRPGSLDGAVCLFDAIGYVRTNEGVASVLDSLASAIHSGGRLVIEFWHAVAMVRAFERTRVRHWPTDGGEVLRISQTTLDVPNQLSAVTYTVLELGSTGGYERFDETQVNRWFLVQEMAAHLDAAGFEPLEFRDGFDGGPVSEETWHVLAVADRR